MLNPSGSCVGALSLWVSSSLISFASGLAHCKPTVVNVIRRVYTHRNIAPHLHRVISEACIRVGPRLTSLPLRTSTEVQAPLVGSRVWGSLGRYKDKLSTSHGLGMDPQTTSNMDRNPRSPLNQPLRCRCRCRTRLHIEEVAPSIPGGSRSL